MSVWFMESLVPMPYRPTYLQLRNSDDTWAMTHAVGYMYSLHSCLVARGSYDVFGLYLGKIKAWEWKW